MLNLHDFKIVMADLSLIIMTIGYIYYSWQTIRRHAVPHPLAWIPFGFLTGTGWLVQVAGNAGPGAWVMGWTALWCFVIGFLGFAKYKRKTTAGEWASLVLSVVIFGFYLGTKNATLAAILATTTDVILYYPIFKKGWDLPHEDSAMGIFFNSLKFIPSMFAMNEYSIATSLYPVAMIVINAATPLFLVWRRQYVSRLTKT